MTAPSQDRDPLALTGHVLDGKYRVDGLLGKGGMGAVYLATHLGTDRPVALKVIAPQFMANAEFVERFRREARAAGRLRHPNVVNVTDFGFAQHGASQLAYLVMEHLAGCSLGDMLRERTALPLLQVVDIAEQTCLALTEAHKRGIIHRDLKPDNLWLEEDGRGGHRVKVLDFGLAKMQGDAAPAPAPAPAPTPSAPVQGAFVEAATAAALAAQPDTFTAAPTAAALPTPPPRGGTLISVARPAGVPARGGTVVSTPSPLATNPSASEGAPSGDLTMVGMTLGTPAYMSPEQCSGKTLDPRSDIYSLGVMVYEMLAGERPFEGDTASLLRSHVTALAPTLRQRARKHSRSIPRAVSRFVMTTLAKDPEERPPDAASFAAGFRAHAEGMGRLLQRAMLLYTEHFVRLTLLAAVILLLPTLLAKLVSFQFERAAVRQAGVGSGQLLGSTVFPFFNGLLLYVCITLFSPVVAQIQLAPMARMRIRPLLSILRKRFGVVTRTVLSLLKRPLILLVIGVVVLFTGSALLWGSPLLALFSAPLAVACLWLAYLLIRYWVCIPVIVMEGLDGEAAVTRARELTRGSLAALLWVAVATYALNYLAYGESGTLVERDTDAWGVVSGKIIALPFEVILAIIMALTYFKFRQAGGETLPKILEIYRERTGATLEGQG